MGEGCRVTSTSLKELNAMVMATVSDCCTSAKPPVAKAPMNKTEKSTPRNIGTNLWNGGLTRRLGSVGPSRDRSPGPPTPPKSALLFLIISGYAQNFAEVQQTGYIQNRVYGGVHSSDSARLML